MDVNNTIIITTKNYKNKLIKDYKLMLNNKVYTEKEFIKKYYFEYKKDVLVFMKNKYNFIPEISKIILENLYKIKNQEYSTKKLNELKKIKNDLIENGYIIFNNNFKQFVKNKDIITYNIKFENFNMYEEAYEEKDLIDIYKYKQIEEEVINTAMKIQDLINNGININKIKFNILDRSYEGVINRIFNYFNIPFIKDTNNKLYYLDDIKKFINEVDDEKLILNLNEYIEELNLNIDIQKKLIQILNKYANYKFGDVKDILIYELKNESIEINVYEDIVKEINYKTYIPNDDEYIFMLGFNQDIIPKIYKDDNYLNDKELQEINAQTSFDKNVEEEKNLKRFINKTKNLIISYKCESPKQEFGYSNFLSNLKTNEIEEKYDYRNEKLNKLLLANRLDNFILYNDISDDLIDLYSNYTNLEYQTYDNNYEKIDYKIIKKQLKNHLTLSYTNLTVFYKCQFRFLLNNIYKLSTFEQTSSQTIGNLFHKVLEIKYKNNDLDLDKIITDAINEFYLEGLNKKTKFYTEKYRIIIKELIEIIDKNNEKSKFKNTYFEQRFTIHKENDLNIKIVGNVDKIMTFREEDSTYVIVVDYKTGKPSCDFKKVVYGLDMQLLMYLYLIKNTSIIENPKFAGTYLQQIMTEVHNKHKTKTYKEQVEDNCKLMGYTTKNMNIVDKIDSKIDEGSFIKGLKIKKDGEFASTAKVLNDNEINDLLDLLSKNIENAIEEINNSNFLINPKKIGNTNEGCSYCEFKDICYMNNNNIVELEGEYDNEDTEE